MNTTAAFATTAGACAFFAVVTLAEPASAAPTSAIGSNGRQLDGQQAARPDRASDGNIPLADAPDGGDLARISTNGPSLAGQQVMLPGAQQQASSAQTGASGPAHKKVRR